MSEFIENEDSEEFTAEEFQSIFDAEPPIGGPSDSVVLRAVDAACEDETRWRKTMLRLDRNTRKIVKAHVSDCNVHRAELADTQIRVDLEIQKLRERQATNTRLLFGLLAAIGTVVTAMIIKLIGAA